MRRLAVPLLAAALALIPISVTADEVEEEYITNLAITALDADVADDIITYTESVEELHGLSTDTTLSYACRRYADLVLGAVVSIRSANRFTPNDTLRGFIDDIIADIPVFQGFCMLTPALPYTPPASPTPTA